VIGIYIAQERLSNDVVGNANVRTKAKIAAAEKSLDARRALFKERINMEEQQ